jgi:hypothetical protein
MRKILEMIGMKINKLIALILLFSLNAQAACDWSKGITPGPNNTFIYTQECHQAVGQLVQANKDLTAAIQLKDLAIQNSDARVALWQKSSNDEFDRLQKIESDQKHNDWLYFGLGIATTFVAAYAASRVYR